VKVATIVGARPQFVKCALVTRHLRQRATEVLVHTGQHYDNEMSGVFFGELTIPDPDYHLGVGSGPHGRQTAAMLDRIEQVLLAERPQWVLVYGDTNSTLAGALAAAKLAIPVAHVEAGLRSFNRRMPEEVNRVMTDHVARLLLCPTPTAVANLAAEGIAADVHLVGDVMLDALQEHLIAARARSAILERLDLRPREYIVVTVHRAENTDCAGRLSEILAALATLARRSRTVVFPIHPRTRASLARQGLESPAGVLALEPVSYLDMLHLESQAGVVVTDSGGMQKEAWWLGVPCVILRDETEWVETLASGRSVLAGAGAKSIVDAVEAALELERTPAPVPNSQAARAIVDRLLAASA
jgi:UDP-GlcNAc3NAcA epimerase